MEITRFAFDIGTNSIGWAVLRGQREADDTAREGGATRLYDVVATGARIFSDGRNPQDGSSLAMMRREPRAARKRRDRFLRRQRKLIHLLIHYSLLPAAEGERKRLERLDPYKLRADGLDDALEPFELGRALFHLNQRRGFQSNRKTDNKEDGVLKQAQKRLEEALARDGSRTLGEFLFKRLHAGDGARFRITGTGPKAEHEFYPTRKLVRSEFEVLWNRQAEFHPGLLTEEAKQKIADAIFHQRPLKEVRPGRCTFNPGEERLPAALPSVEARRIYQEVNELRYGEGFQLKISLTRTERDVIVSKLLMGERLGWDKLRKALKLPASTKLSLEEARDELKGCATAAILKGKKGKEIFWAAWHGLPLDRKDEVVWRLLNTENEETLVAWLMAKHGLDAEAAERAANANLPDGFTRLGKTANAAILDQLRAHHDFTYAKAAESAGYHHSDFSPQKLLDRLPYYGKILERHVSFGTGNPADSEEKRYGKFANPTVHIGLNQLRKLANKMIEEHGCPDEVVVELARELKQTKKQKDDAQRENIKNRQTNDRYRKLLGEQGLPENAGNIVRLRLWEEQRDGLQSFCPYSGEQISIEQLFSDEVEVDHILPFSRALDDSAANKIVCFRSSNRGKGNRTPFEHFGSRPIWAAIEANVGKLKANKRWRFAPDAMEKFNIANRDFLARQLNETKHLARVAKTYLERVSPQVWVVTGSLTAMLRGKWGLNSILEGGNRKNRDDHRHHAIDAFTIGCISRSLLNELSRRAGQAEERGDERIVADIPDPFDNYRDRLRDLIRTVTVSHKPEHNKGGALHEETAYGIVEDAAEKRIGNLVYRKALAALTPNDLEKVRDTCLRAKLLAVRDRAASKSETVDAKALAASLLAFAEEQAKAESERTGKPRNPIRHVRLLKPEASNVVIADRRTGAPYKVMVPGQNWCMDIVSVSDGNGGYVWKGFAASIFDVNRKDWRPEWERNRIGGKLIMRLHKGDLVEIDDKDGVRRRKRVVRLSPSNNIVYLAGHNEAGDLQKRHNDKEDPFRWDFAAISGLNDRKARKVRVNEIGQVRP